MAARELGNEFDLARNRTGDVETKYNEIQAAVINWADRLVALLDKIGRMDVPALEMDTTLDGVRDSDEAIEAWLLLRDGYYIEILDYLRATSEDDL
jgi:hypothetical protein